MPGVERMQMVNPATAQARSREDEGGAAMVWSLTFIAVGGRAVDASDAWKTRA
ncbi:MAG: hypothetical protein AAF813_10340 [Pseudomonadota bacterium]